MALWCVRTSPYLHIARIPLSPCFHLLFPYRGSELGQCLKTRIVCGHILPMLLLAGILKEKGLLQWSSIPWCHWSCSLARRTNVLIMLISIVLLSSLWCSIKGNDIRASVPGLWIKQGPGYSCSCHRGIIANCWWRFQWAAGAGQEVQLCQFLRPVHPSRVCVVLLFCLIRVLGCFDGALVPWCHGGAEGIPI